MKILILAIAILVLVTGVVIWESRYVTVTAASLIRTAEQMPSPSVSDTDHASQDFDTFQRAYTEFRKTWDDTVRILCLFVGHTETERIEAALEETGVRYLSDDIPGYRSARNKLIAELQKLRDLEKFSFDSFT
ncbi:MAG: DUF4363 family protein [Clostridia bacterium]|nr:DUF4363 family protein [Clostridia bacterium]